MAREKNRAEAEELARLHELGLKPVDPAELIKRFADAGKPKVLHGAVAILDALGVRDRDIAGAQEFLKACDGVLEDIGSRKERLLNYGFESGDVQGLYTHVMTFGDTIVFTAGFTTPGKELTALKVVTLLAAWSVAEGLGVGLLLRGSIACGDYLKDRNIVLGPCVADAAAWYDKADWVGVFLTPTTSLRAGQNREHWGQYEVPFRRGSSLERVSLSAVKWPLFFGEDEETFRDELARHLGKRVIPLGAESKAAHTLQYFDFVDAERRKRIR